METVQRWTGRESRLLRQAMRLSLRDFAAHLGVSDRAVSKWEAGAAGYVPRPDSQAILDTALAQAPDEMRVRFHNALGADSHDTEGPAELHVDSHKFLPVFIGTERAQALLTADNAKPSGSWLETAELRAQHPDAAECTVHVAPCGVALFHIVQPQCPDSLTELALWRYRSYASDLPWAAQAIEDLIDGRGRLPAARPEYVLSLYWVHASPWSGEQLHTALRLLSTPSVLVDRGATDGVTALDGPVEETLLASGFDHPDVVPFGVRGVSAGYAGWSGLAYTSLSAERSLGVGELVACELAVQTLWCYSRQIQQMIEDGQDPAVPEQYGWRFLRAAYSRLTAARPQETAQHCLMREAIVKTSGLAERLRDAQDALRDSDIG
jgi:transcriptional regulator with XRE-family HTH domain